MDILDKIYVSDIFAQSSLNHVKIDENIIISFCMRTKCDSRDKDLFVQQEACSTDASLGSSKSGSLL